MNITENTIESRGNVFASNYCQFRKIIGEELRDALENGDAISTLNQLQDNFRLAFLHALSEHDQTDLAIAILNS